MIGYLENMVSCDGSVLAMNDGTGRHPCRCVCAVCVCELDRQIDINTRIQTNACLLPGPQHHNTTHSSLYSNLGHVHSSVALYLVNITEAVRSICLRSTCGLRKKGKRILVAGCGNHHEEPIFL